MKQTSPSSSSTQAEPPAPPKQISSLQPVWGRRFRLPAGRGACATTAIALLCMLCSCLRAADPDWPVVEKHALDLLETYVRIASVNPPANTAEAAALIKRELDAAGFTTKLYTSGPNGQTNLIVRLPGRDRSKKPLLLLNHLDVVPVDANAWGAIDPFGAAIKDGQIWGRGSLDMKALAVGHLRH